MLPKFLAAIAALSLTAVPASAQMPIGGSSSASAARAYGSVGRGWGSGWGWGGGYRDRYRHRRGGSTAGDILTGVLILGTIAAVANAAKKSQQRRTYPDRYPNPDWRTDGPQGLDGAADLCVREAERNARVREVTRVERNAGGWLVTGQMADGAGFTCSIGAEGRIERLDVGGRAQDLRVEDRQYNDDTYRSARADADVAATSGPQPAYPGGPLPGDELEDAPES